jgi:hypothetical protein
VPAYAGTRQDLPVSPGKALDAVISSKVRQLVVLKRDLERFNCEALELRGSRRRAKP